MLNVAKLAALPSERLMTFVDQAVKLHVLTSDSLLWVRNGRLTPQADEVLKELRHADEKGLDRDDYDGHINDFRFATLELPARPSESALIRFFESLPFEQVITS